MFPLDLNRQSNIFDKIPFSSLTNIRHVSWSQSNRVNQMYDDAMVRWIYEIITRIYHFNLPTKPFSQAHGEEGKKPWQYFTLQHVFKRRKIPVPIYPSQQALCGSLETIDFWGSRKCRLVINGFLSSKWLNCRDAETNQLTWFTQHSPPPKFPAPWKGVVEVFSRKNDCCD